MTFLRQHWQHALLNLLVIYGLYTILLLDASRDFAVLVAYLPVSLLFLGFAFGCHKGFKWAYLLLVGLLLVPAVALTYLGHRTSGGELFLYVFISTIGQVLGWVMRWIVLFLRRGG